MKRIGHLYERIMTLDNVLAAMVAYNRRRKRHLKVEPDAARAARLLERMKADFAAVVGSPREKTIMEGGKERRLQIPSYESAVAQIAVWNVCGAHVERRVHTMSFSSRRGYGGHLAARKCERYVHLNHEKAAKYHLYFDIRKFYQHIDGGVMMERLGRIFKNERTLGLFRAIVESAGGGLPIGYPFSHALANLYLTPLYYRLCAVKGVGRVFVYMDNWNAYGANKKCMHRAAKTAREWLRGVGCEMKGDWQVSPTAARGTKICGFVVYAARPTRLYRGIWHRTVRFRQRMLRKMKRWHVSEDALPKHDRMAWASRLGWIKAVRAEDKRVFREVA